MQCFFRVGVTWENAERGCAGGRSSLPWRWRRAADGFAEGLPNHGGCKPLACRNVALTPENTAAWQREIERTTRRLATRPTLPPLLRHRLEARRTEITAFLLENTTTRESA